MKLRNIAIGLVISLGVLLIGALVVTGHPTSELGQKNSLSASIRGAMPLARPVFAEGTTAGTFLDDEAGISAYTNVGQQIDLQEAKGAFRTIEQETDTFIIGSVALPGYVEAEDVHAFVHRDGWIASYYLRDEPAAKIVDWKSYTGGATIGTKLEAAISLICATIGVPVGNAKYYHFKYPSANELIIAADALQTPEWDGTDSREDSFRIKIPGDFTVYERSYSHYNYCAAYTSSMGYYNSRMRIDATEISYIHLWFYGPTTEWTNYGPVSLSRLMPDAFRTITITVEAYYPRSPGGKAFGAIVLVYQKP